jgi:hypothetical protein
MVKSEQKVLDQKSTRCDCSQNLNMRTATLVDKFWGGSKRFMHTTFIYIY